MTIRTKFTVAVYCCDVHVICCKDIRKSVNYHCKKYDPKDKGIDYQPDGFFFRPYEKIGSYYIWFDINTISVNTVNHEKSHLVEEILKDRKIKPKGEARAYLEGYISEKFDAFFKYQENNLKFK